MRARHYFRSQAITLLPPCEQSLVLISWENEALPESLQALKSLQSKGLWLFNLVFSRQSGFPFIDKPMIITEPTCRTIRPGFETLSQQDAAHAQQRCYSFHAESLEYFKISLAKEGFCWQATAVLLCLVPITLWIPISRNQEILIGPIIFIKWRCSRP